MAYLQRNSYFKDLSGNEVFEGQPHKIEDLEYTSLRISVQTDVSGTLTVLQSLDGYTWNEFNDTFAISSTSHKQVDVKGRYVYVMYENGAAIASPFQLYSVLSKSGVSASGGVGLQEVLVVNDSLAVTGLNFDASGNLRVSGISGGGVSSDVNITNALLAVSDASSHELLTDLSGAVWENTDRMLYDLDIIANHGTDASANAIAGNLILDEIKARLHDISGTVSINNLPAVQEVSGVFWPATQPVSVETLPSIEINNLPALQEVHDASAASLLQDIFNTAYNTEINTMPIAYSPLHLDLETQGATAWADSTLPWKAATNGENGWLYENSTQGGAQVYWYSNSSIVPNAIEPDITLGSVLHMSFVANYRLLVDSEPRHKFYVAIYTKPTGSGDAAMWYHSRKVWELPSTTVISKGCDYMFWAITDITAFRRDLDHLEMLLADEDGDCDPAEIVQFMSIGVDSSVPANGLGVLAFNGAPKVPILYL